jgi:hypothetical protein
MRILSLTGVFAVVAAASMTGCDAPDADAVLSDDPAFAALQERGAEAMGVDQYTSTHVFDALADGGRIELQRDVDDPAGVGQIREHLQQIAEAFQAGDLSTPAFVHAGDVPGAAAIAALGDRIEYVYGELPRGAELRLVTADPEALHAIHEFMAFQRQEHHATGAGHPHAAADGHSLHGLAHVPPDGAQGAGQARPGGSR